MHAWSIAGCRSALSGPPPALALKGKVLSAPGETVTLNIYLLALDRQGSVPDRKVLYASGNDNFYAIGNWAFDTSVDLPPETMAIAFDVYTRQSRGGR